MCAAVSLLGGQPRVQQGAKKAATATKEKAAEVKDAAAAKAGEAEEKVRKRTTKSKDGSDQ